MYRYEAVDYGDNKLKLKESIGELVRRVYRHPSNPDNFYNLKYEIIRNKETENLEKGKWKIMVFVFDMDIRDSKFPLVQLIAKLNKWKYVLAIRHNYLNWIDRIRLYGLFPESGTKKIVM